jgi:hypothetical protein
MDIVVLSWLFGTLAIDLQYIVHDRGGIARQAWLAIEEKFLDNYEARTLHLDAAFWAFVQGDLNMNDYHREMKGMADALHDLGELVADSTLVLNILQGLNKWCDHLKTFLKWAKPFPSFHVIRNNLLLEDLMMDVESAFGSITAFVASGGQQQWPPPPSMIYNVYDNDCCGGALGRGRGARGVNGGPACCAGEP